MKINIAIDGPSAAGKSTIADVLAMKLGYVHLDSGAMYRCTALKCLQNNISLEDEAAVCKMLQETEIAMTPEGLVYLDGKDVTRAIRENTVSMPASTVSKLQNVRKDLVARQQEMAKAKGFIMDGRDIGTVVLKDAEVKVFLTASAKARAHRRYQQNVEKGIPTPDVEEIEKEIMQRDDQDIHRAHSPLRKAEDAVEIDSSFLTIEQVTQEILDLCAPYLEKSAS